MTIITLAASSAFAQAAPPAQAPVLFRFEGAIASTPIGQVANDVLTGPATVNTVRGWFPSNVPMRITSLKATVMDTARRHITVEGRGLLDAGGDGTGTNGGRSVWAGVFCGNHFYHTSTNDITPLSDAGDFNIDVDMADPPMPSSCAAPLLMIANGSLGQGDSGWLAVGLLVKAGVSTDASTYAVGQPIMVTWSGLTSSATNWVAFAPEGSPNTTVTRWTYTGGAASGSFSFEGALAPGRYVARTFADDSYTRTFESAAFVVQ
jgi:hypothetical protein